MILSSLSID